MAAALLSVPRSRVAGSAAAYLHRLTGFGPGRPVVMVPAGSNARSPIATVIRSSFYDNIWAVRIGGFEATAVAETVFTLASRVTKQTLAAVLDEALLTGKTALVDFEPIFDRVLGVRARGAGRLRSLIEERHPDQYGVDSTYLERLLEKVLSNSRIPPARREHPMSINGARSRVDAFIEDWALVVEADSRRWHARQQDFDADRARDNALATTGIQVLRFTYDMLRNDPDGCARTIVEVGTHR